MRNEDINKGWKKDEPLSHWEKSIHSLLIALASRPQPLLSTDELRRAVEALETEAYETWTYYDRWSVAIASILIERGVLTSDDINAEVSQGFDASGASGVGRNDWKEGDLVRVRREDGRLRWRKPHLRCPGYIHGLVGRISRRVGTFPDPGHLAFRLSSPPALALFRVQFSLRDIASTRYYCSSTSDEGEKDVVEVDVYEHWLEPPLGESSPSPPLLVPAPAIYAHSDHEHDHEHEEREAVEWRAVEAEAVRDEESPNRPGRVIGDVLLKLLDERGVVPTSTILSIIQSLDSAGEQLLGARLVARAWVDEDFKRRLLRDAPAAAAELDIRTSNPNAPTLLIVVEDTEEVHNVIVCTLCSCYPASLLGLSPSW